eukprot:ANDGO_03657.mRNA.1 hypothetical protein
MEGSSSATASGPSVPSDVNSWNCIWPVWIDGTLSVKQGRRLAVSQCPNAPLATAASNNGGAASLLMNEADTEASSSSPMKKNAKKSTKAESKKSKGEGKSVSEGLYAVVQAQEIAQALLVLGCPGSCILLELNKSYPRDYFRVGRVRVKPEALKAMLVDSKKTDRQLLAEIAAQIKTTRLAAGGGGGGSAGSGMSTGNAPPSMTTPGSPSSSAAAGSASNDVPGSPEESSKSKKKNKKHK